MKTAAAAARVGRRQYPLAAREMPLPVVPKAGDRARAPVPGLRLPLQFHPTDGKVLRAKIVGMGVSLVVAAAARVAFEKCVLDK